MKLFLHRLFVNGIGLVVLLMVIVPAQVKPVQAETKPGWVITSLAPSETEICIGQKVSVSGEFTYEVGFDASGKHVLAPLSGPDKITTKANLGKTSPQNIYPGVISGGFGFDYEGIKEGQDRIVVDVIASGKPVSEASVTITVKKKCVYAYSLVATMKSDASAEEVVSIFTNTIQTAGKLYVENDPNVLTTTRKLELTTDYVAFSSPHCANLTWSPGLATGKAAATADISSGYLVNFKIAQPEGLNWIFRDDFTCDGQAGSVSGNYDLKNVGGDPWIEHEFLPSGGTANIKLEFFEVGLKNCQIGGMRCTYTAVLTLKREKGN